VQDGTILWTAGEHTQGTYYVVTPAFIAKIFSLALEVKELRAEVAKLQAKDTK
jgi:hypothetical protein